MDPHAAVMGLLHVEMVRQQDLALDTSSVAHLTDRLGTNYAPSAKERKAIQELCAEGSQRLTKIADEILEDHQRLISSNGRYVALKEQLDPYFALLSPARTMPPEILQEIFVACLPAGHNAIMHTSEPPLLLGRVCSAWRTISLSTAALWAAVHLVVPPEDSFITEPILSRSAASRREGLGIWLQRSGDCPLSISLFNASTSSIYVRSFLDTIISYSLRLKALTVSHMDIEDMDHLCSIRPTDVPLLEAVEVLDNPNWSEDTNYLGFCVVPPNLRRLAIKGIHGQTLPPCAWGRITNLTLDSRLAFFGVNLQAAVDLIRQCVNLQHCRLGFPAEHRFTPDPSPPITRITLSQLRTLSVRASSSVNAEFNMATILDSFFVPALEELTVSNQELLLGNAPFPDEPVFSDIMPALDALVARSKCALDALVLPQVTGDLDFLQRCLSRLPGLTSLVLGRMYSPQSPELRVGVRPILTALTASPASHTPPLCPNLTYLHLHYCDTTAADHPILRRLIESRRIDPPEHTTRLESAVISLRCALSLESIESWGDPLRISIEEPHRYVKDLSSARWLGVQPDEKHMVFDI
jgi:hypothetical protein